MNLIDFLSEQIGGVQVKLSVGKAQHLASMAEASERLGELARAKDEYQKRAVIRRFGDIPNTARTMSRQIEQIRPHFRGSSLKDRLRHSRAMCAIRLQRRAAAMVGVSLSNAALIDTTVSRFQSLTIDNVYFIRVRDQILQDLNEKRQAIRENREAPGLLKRMIAVVSRYLMSPPNIAGLAANINALLDDLAKPTNGQ